uniref:SPRY-associated domain-containing protein n=1 Tax=Cyprinus carpio carpio TaxID=630221 RepID=A0A9J8DGT7_CYPCA
MIEDLDTRPQLMTDVKFSSSDSLSSKSSLLDVNASLKASFLGGLVEVGGSAKYLHDTKTSNQQSRVTMFYRETSRFEQLTITQLGQVTYPQVFERKTATHVITAVLYGAQAFMVFDRTFSDDENHQEIEGELNVMVKSIPGFSIEGQGGVEMTEGHKEKAKNITCTFHGDVHLKQNPTTYMEALEVYKKLPTLLGEDSQNAVAIKVWLYPLSLLDTAAAQLVREISTCLISNTEHMIEELGEVERKCNDLSRKPVANIFSDIKERLRLFQNSISIYSLILQKALARVLPAIRGGGMEEKSLDDILKIHYLSPFNAGMLNQWLHDTKSELHLLTSYTKTLKGIKTEDSDGLIISLLDPDIDVVVCLTFTSLKYKDPYLTTLNEFLKSVTFTELDGENKFSLTSSVQKPFNPHDVTSKMRENLSHFRSFSEANKDEKTIHFIISTISDASNPGSSIYLYEKGKLTDKKFLFPVRIFIHLSRRMELRWNACSFTLDPNTANTPLILFEENRKMTCEGEIQPYPDHPDRFGDECPQTEWALLVLFALLTLLVNICCSIQSCTFLVFIFFFEPIIIPGFHLGLFVLLKIPDYSVVKIISRLLDYQNNN